MTKNRVKPAETQPADAEPTNAAPAEAESADAALADAALANAELAEGAPGNAPPDDAEPAGADATVEPASTELENEASADVEQAETAQDAELADAPPSGEALADQESPADAPPAADEPPSDEPPSEASPSDESPSSEPPSDEPVADASPSSEPQSDQPPTDESSAQPPAEAPADELPPAPVADATLAEAPPVVAPPAEAPPADVTPAVAPPTQPTEPTPPTELFPPAEPTPPVEPVEPTPPTPTVEPAEPEVAAYPAHRAADVVIGDGSTVHIRPIRPDDADAIVALHSRFSERTRYLRYFSAYPRIPNRDLRRFVNVDHIDRVAFVAELGGDLIAVGRYERLDPDSAEVAFVVEDAHQGRGLGSVLLEHLAAAARDAGIRRFVAEVLPENGKMMRIFTDAGYVVDRHYDDGVIDLRFDTAETARSLEVLRGREQRTEARSIARLLAPASVAVIGVGRQPESLGRAVLTHLRAGGYTGDIFPVNPAMAQVDGMLCYPSLRDVPGAVDLAVIAVPAAEVPAVVADCAEKGVRGLVVISSGFAETGPAGARAERGLVELARVNGARVVGPNCLGVLNTAPEVRLNATLAGQLPGRGRVGFFSQSGALGIALLEQVDRRGIGLSTFVSAGNRADVSGNDLLQYWQDDPATDVVLLYLETFGNPRKFARVARRLARRKPVVVLKSRTRPPGLSGSGTGPGDRGLQALFESSGVIRVGNLDQLFDVAQLLAYQPLPAGRRVAIVGNSSALGVLAADACAAEGLEVVEGWPADLGSAASPEALAAELHRAALDPRVDAVLVVFIPVIATPHTAYADVLVETAARVHLPVVSTFLAASGVPERLRQGGPAGLAGRGSVPSYPSPEDAAYALGRVAAYAEWRRTPGGQFPSLPGVDEKAARAILNRTLAIEMAYVANGVTAVEPVTLEQPDAAALLKAYGIDVWPVRHCAGLDEAVAAAEVFGYPVVVKAADEALRHRVDLGGVRLDVRSADEVRAAFEAIAARSGFSGAGVLVQPMAPRGVACVVEVAQDSAFGPVVGFGLGGVATDLLGDRAWRSVPLTDADAHALVRAPLAAPMLFGHRGASPVDARALEELLLRVGMLADEIPELRELELHPVLVGDAGLTVLHATVRVAPPTPRHDAGPRRLR